MLDIFQYSFLVRGIEAGVLIAIIAPLIGMFLVLRRYALIADALAHVSLAGVAVGLFLGVNPVLTAIVTCVGSSLLIDKLRLQKKVFGETALALFLSGGLAVAVVLLSLAHGFTVGLFPFLFGSIVTVNPTDIWLIAILSIVVVVVLGSLFKELIYLSFDEEAAQVSGIPSKWVNMIFMILAAITVSVAIPIVGVLLISALMVIPVVTALQFKQSFRTTLIIAEIISLVSVLVGIFSSFYFDLSPGGTIVLVALLIFFISLLFSSKK